MDPYAMQQMQMQQAQRMQMLQMQQMLRMQQMQQMQQMRANFPQGGQVGAPAAMTTSPTAIAFSIPTQQAASFASPAASAQPFSMQGAMPGATAGTVPGATPVMEGPAQAATFPYDPLASLPDMLHWETLRALRACCYVGMDARASYCTYAYMTDLADRIAATGNASAASIVRKCAAKIGPILTVPTPPATVDEFAQGFALGREQCARGAAAPPARGSAEFLRGWTAGCAPPAPTMTSDECALGFAEGSRYVNAGRGSPYQAQYKSSLWGKASGSSHSPEWKRCFYDGLYGRPYAPTSGSHPVS